MGMLVYLTARDIVASGGVGAFLYCVLLSRHHLYFHPLSKFPSPRLAALTKWYELYYDLFKDHGGQFMWQVQELHRRYGHRRDSIVLKITDLIEQDPLCASIPMNYTSMTRNTSKSSTQTIRRETSIHQRRIWWALSLEVKMAYPYRYGIANDNVL
jgi:hypothetical protein